MASEEDKPNTGALATLIVVSVFSMIAVTLGVMAITRDALGTAHAEKEAAGAREYEALRSGQLKELEGGTSIDQLKQDIVKGLKRDPNFASPVLSASAAPAAPPDDGAAPAPSSSGAPQPPGAAAPGAVPGVVAPVSSGKGTNSPEERPKLPKSPTAPPAGVQAPGAAPAPAPAPAGSTNG